jgi:hypothetical protein
VFDTSDAIFDSTCEAWQKPSLNRKTIEAIGLRVADKNKASKCWGCLAFLKK